LFLHLLRRKESELGLPAEGGLSPSVFILRLGFRQKTWLEIVEAVSRLRLLEKQVLLELRTFLGTLVGQGKVGEAAATREAQEQAQPLALRFRLEYSLGPLPRTPL
jgi:hypothetical protein